MECEISLIKEKGFAAEVFFLKNKVDFCTKRWEKSKELLVISLLISDTEKKLEVIRV